MEILGLILSTFVCIFLLWQNEKLKKALEFSNLENDKLKKAITNVNEVEYEEVTTNE